MQGSKMASPIFIGRWTPKILFSLKERPQRHGEWRRHLGNVSQRMLSRTLRKLESAGLIARHANGEPTKRKDFKMRRVQTNALIVGLFFVLTAIAQNKQTPRGMNEIQPLPRDLEVQLALSALPPQLRDNATVSVLNPDKGFEVARQGTNGFHPLVARTGDDTFRGTWPRKQYRDDILYPISSDEAGAKAQMRVFFDAAEVQAQGSSLDEGACRGCDQRIHGNPVTLVTPRPFDNCISICT
jgi:hypothetical protein